MVRGELKSASRSGWAGSLPWRVLFAELGKECGPPFPEGGELSTQLLQFAVDPHQLGPRLLFPQVALAMQGPGEIFDLAAEQPQPRVPVHRGWPGLSLAPGARREDLIFRPAQ